MRHRVAIIGAGPAGCSAALKCSELGLDVVLFEAGSRNKDKACGDAFVAGAVTCLRRFGFTDDRLLNLGGRPFDQIDVGFHNVSVQSLRLSHPGGWIIPRAALDQALRDAVSPTCEIRYNEVVRRLSKDKCELVVLSGRGSRDTRFQAVIVATGAASALSRFLGVDGRPRKALAFRAYGPNPDHDGALKFELIKGAPLRYRWTFPFGETANMGACRLDQCTDDASDSAEVRTLARHPGVSRLVGGIEPLWSGSGLTWHHRWGVVSCGDCAGLVNPTSGEGLSAAFVSGEMAAEAVDSYLAGSGLAGLEQFSIQIRDSFTAKYRSHASQDVLSQLAHTA